MAELRPIVVKLGGAAIDAASEMAALWNAIAELHKRGPVVVVHGGGGVVDARLERLGLQSERIDGLRVTPPAHMEEVVAGLAGVVNRRIVGLLRAAGANATGACIGDGGLTIATRLTHPKGDLGMVGQVDPATGDPTFVRTLLHAGFLPTLSSIGMDAHGETLNVNADDAAAAVASVVGAQSLALLTDMPGVLNSNGKCIASLDEPTIEQLIEEGVIHSGMIPKVRGALAAARTAQTPVWIASWKNPSDLLSLEKGTATGTRIDPPASLSTSNEQERAQ